MCNNDTKGNFLIRFISEILFQLTFIFKRKNNNRLLPLLHFQETLTLVNDLIPSQINCILVRTSYGYKREVLHLYFDSI